jgi:hypothetical protein
MIIRSRTVTRYNITDLVVYRRSNNRLLGHAMRSTCSHKATAGRVAGPTIVLVDNTDDRIAGVPSGREAI